MKKKQSIAPVRLRKPERAALVQVLRTGHTGIWIAARARAVLLAAAGEPVGSIARELGRDRKWVRLWIGRFERLRLEGLQDKQRSGRPVKFSP